MPKIAVTTVTLESHNHIVGDIERGIKVYNQGGVEWTKHEPDSYLARVPHKGNHKTVTVSFTRDGQNLEHHHCQCTWRSGGSPVCRHVVAAVLAIQGGIPDTKLALGKTASSSTTVTESNTAKVAGSGSLDVFATPMMVALMEQAACECLADCMEPGQTSVGTSIAVSHTSASPLGLEITATATIEAVFGRRIEFKVSANDGAGEIGAGKHGRAIVDAERFMASVEKKRP